MERAMSLGAVPDDGNMNICGTLTPGRQLRAASGVPVAWVTDWVFSGHCWADLGEKSARSGLQPFLLSGGDGGPGRPRDFGELVSDPEDTTAIDGMDAAHELEWLWDAQFPGEDAGDGELREMFAPFGARFPGLAPAVEEELDPE